MADRFPPIATDDLDSEQRTLYDEFSRSSEAVFGPSGSLFHYKRASDSAFLGPYAPMLSTPGIAKHFLALVLEVGKFAHSVGLTPTAREVAILAVGGRYQAKYEMYAHGRIGRERTDLTHEQVEELCSGKKPKGMDEQSELAYDYVVNLVESPGPLPDDLFERGVKMMGSKEGVHALIQYISIYSFVCVYLNGCDVPLPEGESLL